MAGSERKVNAINLDDAIRDILKNYNEQIDGYVMKGLKKVANDGRKKLRSGSPVAKHNGGTYKSGWGYKLSRDALGHHFSLVLYNQGDHASLTHLLEKGHAKRNGDFLDGKPHIKPVNDEAQKEFVDFLDDAIRKG